MRSRLVLCSLIAVAVLLGGAAASAQTAKSTAKSYSPRRLPDGHPDLQGTYDLATLTPIERAPGINAVLTPEQATRLEKGVAALKDITNQPLKGERSAPP